MPTNVAGQFSADIENFIADQTLPLAQRQLVAYQFGDPEVLPKGRGTTYTATRFIRLPLPFAALSEGVPALGQSMSIQQVSATVAQWGDKITITDVAELTIKHPLVREAQRIMGYQIAETLERNTFNTLNAGTQINYVNARGARASLLTTDYLNRHEIQRAAAMLLNLGAPAYMGDERTDMKLDADKGGAKSSNNPRSNQHYVSILHPFVEADMREDATITQAWSYSDLNKLYNNELGELNGIRFIRSNLVPFWVGVAAITGTAGSAGSLATNTYFVQVTASDTQNQYESRIYQVSGGIAVTGPNGSISVTLPALTGFNFNIYIGTTSSPANLGLSTAGPTQGSMAGQATQIAPNQTVVITGVGTAQVPPAAPTTGTTVYPTYIFGRGAYAQVELDSVKISLLTDPDKADPFNQTRVLTWKVFYGTLIKNQNFFMRIESVSSFNATFG